MSRELKEKIMAGIKEMKEEIKEEIKKGIRG